MGSPTLVVHPDEVSDSPEGMLVAHPDEVSDSPDPTALANQALASSGLSVQAPKPSTPEVRPVSLLTGETEHPAPISAPAPQINAAAAMAPTVGYSPQRAPSDQELYSDETGAGKIIGGIDTVNKAIDVPSQYVGQKIEQGRAAAQNALSGEINPELAAKYPTLYPAARAIGEATSPIGAAAESLKLAQGMITDPKNLPFLLAGGPEVRPVLKAAGSALFTIMSAMGAKDAYERGDWSSAAAQAAFGLLGITQLAPHEQILLADRAKTAVEGNVTPESHPEAPLEAQNQAQTVTVSPDEVTEAPVGNAAPQTVQAFRDKGEEFKLTGGEPTPEAKLAAEKAARGEFEEPASQSANVVVSPEEVTTEPPQAIQKAGAPKHSYDEIQNAIDDRETELEKQGVDVAKLSHRGLEIPGYQPMPKDLVALYAERDAVGGAELKQSADELHSSLKSAGLSDAEANHILMDKYAIYRGKEGDAASQYMAAEHTQKMAAQDPRKQLADVYSQLAADRGIFMDDHEDLFNDKKTTEDAIRAVKAIHKYFHPDEELPKALLPEAPTETVHPDEVVTDRRQGRRSETSQVFLDKLYRDLRSAGTPEEKAEIQGAIDQERKMAGGQNALREQSTGSLLQREPQENGGGGSGRPGVEPGEQGQEAPRAQAPVGGGAPEVGKVGEMPAQQIAVDPHRFQFKQNTDAEGVSPLLKEQGKFNPDLAGVISVWKDPANGKTYVVNGHHRLELAKRTGERSVVVRHINAADAGEARATGALQNIAEGRGTPLDAAKFMRETGLTPDELQTKGISLGEATARDGAALSHLDDHIFNRATQGDIPIQRAIAIGEATPDHAEQMAILKLVEAKERQGKRVSNDTVKELVRFVKGSGQTTETTSSLFGEEQVSRSLALEKAEVSAYIKQQLANDKRLFGFVAKEGRAAELARGGNKIDVEKNRQISTDAAQAEEVYNKLSERGGSVSSALDDAASKLANGENPNAVKQEAYKAVRNEISNTLGGGQGAGLGEREAEPRRGGDASQGILYSGLDPVAAAKAISDLHSDVSAGWHDFIDKVLDKASLGKSRPEIRQFDPQAADLALRMDAGGQYHKTVAEAIAKKVTGPLTEDFKKSYTAHETAQKNQVSRDRMKGFHFMADAQNREWLRENHPEDFKRWSSDPKIQEAIENYRPFEEQLRQSVKQLGGKTIDEGYIKRIMDFATAGIDKADSQSRGSYSRDNIVGPQVDKSKARSQDAGYYWEHGVFDFGPSFEKRWTEVMHKVDEHQLAVHAMSRGTRIESGDAQPPVVFYNGKDFYRPDVAKEIKEIQTNGSPEKSRQLADELGVTTLPLPKNVQEYGIYQPLKGARFENAAKGLASGVIEGKDSEQLKGQAYGVSKMANLKYAVPREIADALNDADRSAGQGAFSKKVSELLSPITQAIRQQIVGLGYGVPHMGNVLRKVMQSVPGGVVNPRAWAEATRVAFSRELKARAISGVNDPTFDMLLRNAGISEGAIPAYKHYVEGNFDRANWATTIGNSFRSGGRAEAPVTGKSALAGVGRLPLEALNRFSEKGHNNLFKSGGIDQRARVWLADFVKDRNPRMNDADIAHAVNQTLGRYNRASWTDVQRGMAPYMLFPGWDYSSVTYALKHPVRTAVAPALLTFLANRVLNSVGANQNQDKNDLTRLHVGQRSFKTNLVSDNMGNHMMGWALRGTQAVLDHKNKRDVVGAAVKGLPGDVAGASVDTMNPILSAGTSFAYGKTRAGSGRDIAPTGDFKKRGSVLPNKGAEDMSDFAMRKAVPLYDMATGERSSKDSKKDRALTAAARLAGVTTYKTKR